MDENNENETVGAAEGNVDAPDADVAAVPMGDEEETTEGEGSEGNDEDGDAEVA